MELGDYNDYFILISLESLGVAKCVSLQKWALAVTDFVPWFISFLVFILSSTSQELAKYFLAELLSEPNQTENDALEPEDLSQAAEQDEMRLELQRSANSNPAMAPRERKAGCKNFFWKTFTSC